IDDTLKPVPNLYVHLSKDADGLQVGQKYTLAVDASRRKLIKANHSATHLLQAALRQVLGTHVNQAGSSVGPDKLRFDFTHHQAVSKEELQQVAQIVNEQIQHDLPVNAKIMDKEEALKTGAQALFGEKYGAQVRVMTMGDFSKEFCGGTHVAHTGEIELLVILSESSLASGVRRIEAVTRQAAFNFLLERHGQLSALENQFNLKASRLAEHFGRLQDELKQTQKLLAEQKTKLMAAASGDLAKSKQVLASGLTFWPIKVEAGEDLKKLSDVLANQMPESGLMVLHQQKDPHNPTANILLKAVHHEKLDCAQLLKTSLQGHQGKGGGRASLAQGSIAAGEIPAWLEQLSKLLCQ
ncbi:MAG: alanine--tRNA ligase, partial [Bacteriovoracaceae bacterium]|nr:alanine--tRNA ligase [Bacteriovoracaceae bacterium]